MELSDWLELVADSARELAETALGTVQVAFLRVPGAPPPDRLQGVYLPLFSEGLALQLGLLAEPEDCAKLARRFLGLPAGEPLDAEGLDVLGAFGNLIVGGLEARLEPRRKLSLGVPLALRGRAFPLGGAASLDGVLEIEDSLLWLVLSGSPPPQR
ncbi:MAG: hypothetical protein RL685_1708 [Pseudomonadota bacterium]|jgi:hypothetical protein